MRPDRLYLADIIDAADAVAAFLAGVDRAHFMNDDLSQSAVLHKLTVVGEAAARISASTKLAHPEVPWNDVIGFRNVAIHAYFAVNWVIVWTTATEDLPSLRAVVAGILATLADA